jgi:hypothetical protein
MLCTNAHVNTNISLAYWLLHGHAHLWDELQDSMKTGQAYSVFRSLANTVRAVFMALS